MLARVLASRWQRAGADARASETIHGWGSSSSFRAHPAPWCALLVAGYRANGARAPEVLGGRGRSRRRVRFPCRPACFQRAVRAQRRDKSHCSAAPRSPLATRRPSDYRARQLREPLSRNVARRLRNGGLRAARQGSDRCSIKFGLFRRARWVVCTLHGYEFSLSSGTGCESATGSDRCPSPTTGEHLIHELLGPSKVVRGNVYHDMATGEELGAVGLIGLWFHLLLSAHPCRDKAVSLSELAHLMVRSFTAARCAKADVAPPRQSSLPPASPSSRARRATRSKRSPTSPWACATSASSGLSATEQQRKTLRLATCCISCAGW